MTEINKLLSIYGFISYFDKKGTNEAAQIISFINSLKVFVPNDTVKNSLDFKLTKINGSIPAVRVKKVHNVSFTKIGTKRKKQMNEPIQTVIIRSQQKFDLHDILNLIEIEINDGRILNILKRHKLHLLQFDAYRYFVSVISNKSRKTNNCNLRRIK